jgi:hypothetical protein
LQPSEWLADVLKVDDVFETQKDRLRQRSGNSNSGSVRLEYFGKYLYQLSAIS